MLGFIGGLGFWELLILLVFASCALVPVVVWLVLRATVLKSGPVYDNLVPCPNCGGRISKEARACPHCGQPFE